MEFHCYTEKPVYAFTPTIIKMEFLYIGYQVVFCKTKPSKHVEHLSSPVVMHTPDVWWAATLCNWVTSNANISSKCVECIVTQKEDFSICVRTKRSQIMKNSNNITCKNVFKKLECAVTFWYENRFTSTCSKECSYSLYLEGFDLLFVYNEVWRDEYYY